MITRNKYFIIEMNCIFFDLTPGKQYIMDNDLTVIFDDDGSNWPLVFAFDLYKVIGVISNIKLK